jgi:biofilm PGA synthesis N-glycosyltransferase PgaC
MNHDFFGETFVQLVFDYVFYYPFLMAYVWIGGGIAYALVFERQRHLAVDPLPLLPATPLVSVVAPCYNEENCVRDVIEQLMRTRYPNFEVIAVNDGSTDGTGAILDHLALEYTNLRVVHHQHNQGKAVGLNTAVLMANGEFILGVDGDALVDPDAIAWMLGPLLRSSTVGAVTGNPRIRTRTTLLGRMQVGEFSSTIGLIKRSQQLLGRLFTVSGVMAMFRRKALLDTGFWSLDVLTEDIDISWKLQLGGWRLRFEPRALCWILMPETIRGLYRQRQRWATGGIQTLIRHSGELIKPRHFKMWPIFIEYLASVLWAYAMLFVLIIVLIRQFVPSEWHAVGFWPQWHGVLLGITCMLQMLVSLWIDRHYDKDVLRYFVWTIWYPFAFWTISMITTVLAIPITLMRRRGKRATWNSPDRGAIDAKPDPATAATPE